MTHTCHNCAGQLRDTARFCPNCGAAVTGSLGATNPLTGRLPSNTLLQERYIVLERIGRGGMAAVYRAADNRIQGKQWAVKEMSSAALGSAEQQQQAVDGFRQEAQLLARLNHANLPRVVDYFDEEGKHFLVMEYIAGQTLEQRLGQQAPLPENKVLLWAHQLCDVLAYLHSRPDPVIFRDLKPANIMVTPEDRVYLIDFGIARFFKAEQDKDTIALGTQGYAAPEQYGRDQSDGRTDVYGLGATLHHLLTGRDPRVQPFDFPPVRRLNPAISQRTADAVARAVQRDREQRFPSVEAMAAALPVPQVSSPLDETVRVGPPPPPPPAPGARSGGRRPWLPIAAVIGLVAVLGLVAAVMANRPDATPTPAPAQVVMVITSAPDPTETLRPTVAATATATAAAVLPTEPPTDTPSPSPSPEPSPTVRPSATPLPNPNGRVGSVLGSSAGGQPIEVRQFGSGPNAVIFIGGMHSGFAPSSELIMIQAIAHFGDNPQAVPDSVTLYIVPDMNPDSAYDPGYRPGRLNANGVDLNRNWDCEWEAVAEWDDSPISGGSAPFSEPETAALRDFILSVQPEAVLFYEARAYYGLVTPGSCNGVYSGSAELMNLYYPLVDYQWFDGGDVISGDASNWVAKQGMASIAVILKQFETLPPAELESNLAAMEAVLARYK